MFHFLSKEHAAIMAQLKHTFYRDVFSLFVSLHILSNQFAK